MKNNRTELVFILDRSGSMGGLETDTIGGFNAMLKKQQAVEGDCQVTTVLFDDEYELLHNQMDIHEVKPMTDKEYYVRGCTALYDAVGRTIHTIAAEQRPDDKVLFVIITDGYENASTEYTGSQIKAVIEKMKTERNWQFVSWVPTSTPQKWQRKSVSTEKWRLSMQPMRKAPASITRY